MASAAKAKEILDSLDEKLEELRKAAQAVADAEKRVAASEDEKTEKPSEEAPK